jgi:uncharacterized membrane protein
MTQDPVSLQMDSYSEPDTIGRVLIALGIGALGLLSLFAGDFAFQWQSVPDWVPARGALARLTGLILATLSLLMIVPRTARRAVGAMTVVFWIWVLLFQLPRVARGEIAAWIGCFEFTAMAGACWALLGMIQTRSADSGSSSWFVGKNAIVIGTFCFAISLPPFGLSHFMYAEPAAALLPPWMPAKLFFTYLTGAGHIAAGLSLLTGVLARAAAPLLCVMFGSFVLLLHLPRVLMNPTSRYEWTMLFVSIALNGAAWVIAGAVRASEKRTRSERAVTPLSVS